MSANKMYSIYSKIVEKFSNSTEIFVALKRLFPEGMSLGWPQYRNLWLFYFFTMDKQSAYLLQKIDCNCNDCKHMLRNNYKQELCNQQVSGWHRSDYDRNREDALSLAFTFRDKVELAKLEKQKFQPAKSTLAYGYCKRFDFKEVSFMPNTLQLETQGCFEHRKDL